MAEVIARRYQAGSLAARGEHVPVPASQALYGA
jgi:hypothetical protein